MAAYGSFEEFKGKGLKVVLEQIVELRLSGTIFRKGAAAY